ncbi:uncharacterized protein LOC110461279 [Mizuhopecten yessoensis]|uniref:Cyclic GMP-AMP synthase n=1 Tax=Mizuhopecten yessoensis TaxID=6573 RepID=A0A210Q0X4_MIZYE|nr:uncharacterized protein LOC110461279 [Mizuhopecten yessoensis]OWF42319.1 Cyclic GMP-AMP synthase [Mizuhopecten yessoensis]
MADQGEQYEKSWILHHILNRFIGNRETVAVRRRMTILRDNLHNFGNHGIEWFFTGSLAEGLDMVSSDRDIMLVDTTVIVTCPFHDSNNPSDSTDRTVVVMKEADNRPGYVTLELVNPEQAHSESIMLSIVPVGDVLNISGVHTQSLAETFSSSMVETLKTVCSFPYTKWPREANEWVNRPRLHGWPEKALRDEIVQGGCYLVHVGDISSPDTFLQWRISFTTAERKLIHSLSHTQFLIYGLLKYILKQISDRFKQQMGEADVLSSYIITTVIFHAVKNTPGSLWQERNTFVCFLLCLKILIGWVHAGHCPNYFINGNNMFNGKVHGENQQKLLSILTELHDMKWGCLSVGSVIRPTIGDRRHRVMNGAWGYPLLSPTNSEMKSDMKIFIEAFAIAMVCTPYVALALLSKSKEDIDEFVAYLTTVHALAFTGIYTLEKTYFC